MSIAQHRSWRGEARLRARRWMWQMVGGCGQQPMSPCGRPCKACPPPFDLVEKPLEWIDLGAWGDLGS